MTDLEILVIIPARGGSKGIPRKNIKIFAGHPLIAYSIAAAKGAMCYNRCIVSTDDHEIAEISRLYGAETPFMRPGDLAGDHITDLPVFQHALEWLQVNENYHPDLVVHLHATSPVRPNDCLDRGIQLIQDHPEAECVRSVVIPSENPFKMWFKNESDGHIRPIMKLPAVSEPYNLPRQALPQAYLQTGHTNVIRTRTIEAGSMTGKNLIPLIIDRRYEIDLDTLEDWEYGEWVVTHRNLDMIWPERKA